MAGGDEKQHRQEVGETAGGVFDLALWGGPLGALVGALLAALGFGLKRRRRRRQAS